MSSEKNSRERLLKIALKHMTVKASTIEMPLFHISFKDNLSDIWKPRNPDTDDNHKKVSENIQEPDLFRISTSDTVINCFRAIYPNISHYFEEENYPYLDIYVYTPIFKGDEKVLSTRILTEYKIIHDAHITNEYCILSDTEFKLHSKVRIKNTKNNKGFYYHPFNDKSLEKRWILDEDIDVVVLKTY